MPAAGVLASIGPECSLPQPFQALTARPSERTAHCALALHRLPSETSRRGGCRQTHRRFSPGTRLTKNRFGKRFEAPVSGPPIRKRCNPKAHCILRLLFVHCNMSDEKLFLRKISNLSYCRRAFQRRCNAKRNIFYVFWYKTLKLN